MFVLGLEEKSKSQELFIGKRFYQFLLVEVVLKKGNVLALYCFLIRLVLILRVMVPLEHFLHCEDLVVQQFRLEMEFS